MSIEIKTLEAILQDVRYETRRSANRNHGIGEEDSIKYLIQREQRRLWWAHDWKHLRVIAALTINAGQRYYDAPAGISLERINRFQVDFGGEWIDLHKGVDMTHYSIYNSDDDERADPAERWDVRNTGAAAQIEIWPLAASEQSGKLSGIKDLGIFVADEDNCTLDATLITLYAAAKLKPDEPSILAAANDLYKNLSKSDARVTPNNKVSMIGRDSPPRYHPRRIVPVYDSGA